MSIRFLEYQRCSTCRKAKAFLESHNVSFVDQDLTVDTPSAQELAELIMRSGLSVRKFFNTSGMKYRSMHIKDKLDSGLSFEECCELLSSDGMLIKRPLLIADDTILVGFKEQEYRDALL